MTNKQPTMKTIIVMIVSIAILAGAAIFIYRYKILQYSAEKIVRKMLPDYIIIDRMSINVEGNKIILGGLKILNPPNFAHKYLVEIDEMTCGFKMKGSNILDGIEITDPVFKKPFLYVERLADSRTNLQMMPAFLQGKAKNTVIKQPAVVNNVNNARVGEGARPKRAISDMVKLPENFTVKEGRAVFVDGMVRPGMYKVTFENVEAGLYLRLDSTYTKALAIASTGTGSINGRNNETIRWDVKYDPTTPRLTMSSRLNVSGVNIMAFKPYYDRYSPLDFRGGYFSGLLIFDFDNGQIGSTDEVHLSRLSFSIKPGYENAQYLETTVPDLVKYFTSSSGDVIFDFKIKGDMANPQFYLGPISKQALAVMAIDKIGQALAEAAKQQAGQIGNAKDTNIEKAAEYIDMFKGLLKDKK